MSNQYINLVGRLAHEVGWQYKGVIEKLEQKRMVRGAAFHEKKKAQLKLKAQALKIAEKKIAPYQKILEQYGHA